MTKLPLCFALLWMCFAPLAQADVIPPDQIKGYQRLKANPKLFDRNDSYCAGKSVGAECTIPGSTLAGGGNGTCRNELGDKATVIDLTCRRAGYAQIERGLPSGGFVNDARLCQDKANAVTDAQRAETQKWNCTPLQPMPADRFCQGKAVGERCTVELTYRGKTEQNEGVCKQLTEKEGFYYQGRRIATREVIKCEPEQEVVHEYTPATWWQKLWM